MLLAPLWACVPTESTPIPIIADAGTTADFSASTITATPGTFVADGVSKVSIEAIVRASQGTGAPTPLPGVFVTFAVTGTGNVVGQSTTATDPSGRSPGFLTTTVAGPKKITATMVIAGQTIALPGSVTVNALPPVPAGPAKLAFAQQPTEAVAGAAITPAVKVALQDASGAVVTNATGAVTIALGDNALGANLSGTLTVMAVGGVATFSDLSIDRAGSGYTLVAHAANLPDLASGAFRVVPGAAAKLAMVDEPADGLAGEALSPDVVVEARDALGNRVAASGLVITATATPSGSTSCPASSVFSAATSAGTARFSSIVLNCAATYALQLAATGVQGVTSRAFSIQPADLDHFRLSGVPASVTAGDALSFTATALDAFENTVTAYVGTLRFTSTDAAAVLPAAATFSSADAGRRAFTGLVLKTAGTQTFTATDVAADANGTATLSVLAGAPTRLVFLQQPRAGTVRATFTPAPRVGFADGFGNLSTSATATVTLALTPSSGALDGTLAITANAGAATFGDLSVRNEGSGYHLIASSPSLTGATSDGFDVVDNVPPAAPGSLAAQKLGPTSARLTWTAPGDDGLLGNATRYELRMGTSPLSGQGGVLVPGLAAPQAPGSSESFLVSGLSANTTHYFSVTAIDSAGNRGISAFTSVATDPCANGYTGSACTECANGYVHPTGQSSCVSVCLAQNPCTQPQPAATCQNATTLLPRKNPGDCSLSQSAPYYSCSYPALSAQPCGANQICTETNGTGACVVAPPTFVFSSAPTTMIAGTSQSFTLTVRDPFGQIYAGYTGTVRFTASDPQAVVPASYAFTANDGGVKSFAFTLKTAGSRTLTATDQASAATQSATISVTPAAAASIAWRQQPSNVNVRTAIAPAPAVAVLDPYGNLVSDPAVTIVVEQALNPGAATLAGTLSVATSGGIAAFTDLALDNEGVGFTLNARALGTSFPVLGSAPFTVTDNVAPGPITDFVALIGLSLGTIDLDWTHPGDDGLLGNLRAGSSYALRYSTSPITPATFEGAGTVLVTPAPAIGPQGDFVTTTVASLEPLTHYYFALRVDDGAGNRSFAFADATTPGCDPGYTGPNCDQCAGPKYERLDGTSLCVRICEARNPCTTPPAVTCASGTSLNVPPNPGTCGDTEVAPYFACDYTVTTPTPCGSGLVCSNVGGVEACRQPPPTYQISLTPLAPAPDGTAPAGSDVRVTVVALDALAQPYTSYAGSFRLTSSDPAAVLPANATFAPGDLGRKDLVVVLKTAATAQSITVTDLVFATSTASASVGVSAAAPTRLVWVTQPTAADVRMSLTPAPSARAYDAYGNSTPLAADVTATIVRKPPEASLGGILTSTPDASGLVTFTDLELDNEGVFTLRLSTAGGAIVSPESTSFTISDHDAPGPIIDFAAVPTGTTFNSVDLSWTHPGDDGYLGNLPSYATYAIRYSKAPFDAATFETGTTLVSPTMLVGAQGTAAHRAVAGLDSGTLYYFGLRVNDGAGNLDYAFAEATTGACPTGYTGAACDQCAAAYERNGSNQCVRVCAARNPCTAGPTPTCASTSQLNSPLNPGICSNADVAPYYTCDYVNPASPITCTAGTSCSTVGGVSACRVDPPTFVLTFDSAAQPAGTDRPLVVRVNDSLGRPYASYAGTVHFSTSDPSPLAVLPANYTFLPTDATNGKSFPIRVVTVGTQTITINDVALPTATAQVSAAVSHAPASALVFGQQPTNVNVRTAIAPAITARLVDPYGNLATTAVGEVSLALGTNPGNAAFVTGTQTTAPLASGVATLSNVQLDNEGTATLVATGPGALQVTSSSFTVTDNMPPGPISDLRIANADVTQTSVILDWTAPGDDGNLGDLRPNASYEVRYSTAVPYGESNFSTGQLVTLPSGFTPGFVGLPEFLPIGGLNANTAYTFGIQVDDGAGNKTYAFVAKTTLPCPTGTTGATCQSCDTGLGYVQTGGPGVCTHVCTAQPLTACPSQPANACSTNTLQTYSTVCTVTTTSPGYACAYPQATTDCTTTSKICLSSPSPACVTDPCVSNPCSAPAGPACGADGVSVVTTTLSCTPQTPTTRNCTYPTSTTACTTPNNACYSGACVASSAPAAGELVFTEIMHTPANAYAAWGEWLEVKNTSTKYLNLVGLELKDDLLGSATPNFTVTSTTPILVAPGGYFVFGASTNNTDNGGANVQYAWPGGFGLLPLSSLRIRNGTTVIDGVDYDTSLGWPSTTGHSMNLSSQTLHATANDGKWWWCDSTAAMSGGNGAFGTPGAANGACGVPTGLANTPVTFCRTQFPPAIGSNSLTVSTADSTTAYARLYQGPDVTGITTRCQACNDFYPWLVAQVGYGATGTSPTTWTWTSASEYSPFGDGSEANNDEVKGNLAIPTAGTFKYGFRMGFMDPVTQAQPTTWTYCGRNNTWSTDPAAVTYVDVTVNQAPTVSSINPTPFVIRGAQLVLTGLGFTGTTSVTIGGVTQSFVQNSDTQLTIATVDAATPLGATTIVVVASGRTGPAFNTTVSLPLATDLFISEYGEGTSNNKYIEIYNGTSAAVDLSGYSLATWFNGGASPTNTWTWPAGTMLARGATRVICHGSIDTTGTPSLASKCNDLVTGGGVCNFNGDDGIALRKGAGNTIIDVVGNPGAADPGTSWTACGDANATTDKISTRKPTIKAPNATWSSSAGTNATDCEWIISSASTLANMQTNNTMGTHNYNPAP